MAAKKIIVVVGSTGNQGGSVVDTFLGLPNWQVRGMTRDSSSTAAQALRDKGVEVVQGNLEHVESLIQAFEGASAIFLNTQFWDVFYATKAALEAEGKDIGPASQKAFDYENMCGRNAAKAAVATPTLKRFVISSLPSVVTDGKYTRSLHPESKNCIVEYIEKEQPDLAKKLSVIWLCAYNDNPLLKPTKDEASGVYRFVSPVHANIRLPTIDPKTSTGPFVRALIETEEPGVKLLAYDSYLTLGEIVETWSKAAGKQAVLVPVTTQQVHAMGGLWEHLDAVDYLNEHDAYEEDRPGAIRPHHLKTPVQTRSYEQWVKDTAWD